MRIGVAQLNLVVGDIENNTACMLDVAAKARDSEGAALVIFPELAITGYPPEDLLLRPALYHQVDAALRRMEQAARDIDILVGLPESDGGNLYNCCRYLRDGRTFAVYRKRILPNYGVFDEKRYFTPGAGVQIVDIGGIPCSLSICEDLWTPEHVRDSADRGAKVLININGSPYHAEKYTERYELLLTRMRESGLAIIYANLVGGQDELIFDGGSMAIDAAGNIVPLAPQFREGLFMLEMNAASGTVSLKNAGQPAPLLSRTEGIYEALVLGVRDYVAKNRFNGVVLGLSGGIDSALTLCIAVDALGADRVEALIMPSRFTATLSIEDARQLAERLRAAYRIISIEGTFGALTQALAPMFEGLPADATEENIQARCRGVLLMAVSNKTGRMVLTTGNKSESSVGYATLYG
ncbi:MAG: NAD+ synthase, partial [Gammaproteobacteria bacterium]